MVKLINVIKSIVIFFLLILYFWLDIILNSFSNKNIFTTKFNWESNNSFVELLKSFIFSLLYAVLVPVLIN